MQDGSLKIDSHTVQEHQKGTKRVSSYFFGQAETEHISAVLFTNSGTNAKFARMGYQHGFECESVEITRMGFSFNLHPAAKDPTFFTYSMSEPPLVESWGQGLVVLHNPNCLHPIPKDFFREAVQGYMEDSQYKTDHEGWHPIMSKTLIAHFGIPENRPQREHRVAISAISKNEFQTIWGFAVPEFNPFGEEDGWFTDETESFLGVVIRDKIDNDWVYVILGRDEYFQFRAVKVQSSIPNRDRARMELQLEMANMVSSNKRIF